MACNTGGSFWTFSDFVGAYANPNADKFEAGRPTRVLGPCFDLWRDLLPAPGEQSAYQH
jgi:hypothetical protein